MNYISDFFLQNYEILLNNEFEMTLMKIQMDKIILDEEKPIDYAKYNLSKTDTKTFFVEPPPYRPPPPPYNPVVFPMPYIPFPLDIKPRYNKN